ncbi:hypothetical protein OE88DRAFT_276584 [Heliocybe sulcata]|uniref:Uncharacterized protein n=1 Tax=Heliocybe sulcata TaxID=5364 RepID=A0A5C3N2H4_9AGAM|nr:hypothetical protein OE88DRAFT_276584 [Heliocybe sulcata]
MIAVDVAELAGIIAEAALYGKYRHACLECTHISITGVFVVLFIIAVQFSWSSQSARMNKVTLAVAILMAILATTQLVADTINIFLAFINMGRPERAEFLNDVTQPIFVFKHAIIIVMFFVSDLFVTYRCWLIWHKNIWVVVIPVCLSLGSGAVGFYTLWAFGHSKARTRAAEEWPLIAITSLSLGANAISTFLSALHIWSSSRKYAKSLGNMNSNVTPVVRIVVESGALNAAYMVANTVTWVTGNQGLTVEMVCVSGGLIIGYSPRLKGTPLIGCIFMLVIIRVSMNARQGSTSKGSILLRSLGRSRDEARGADPVSTAPTANRRIVVGDQPFVLGKSLSQTSVTEDGRRSPDFGV